MAATVDIVVMSDDVVPIPVPGVSVSLHDPTTKQLITITTTDGNGIAALVVPAQQYEVRMFKLGVVCGKPYRIDPPDAEASLFDVTVHVITDPVSTDPRTCMCTGRFVDLSNRPMAGVTVRISPRAEQGSQVPEVVDGNQVLGGYTKSLRTDQSGKVSVDLHRGGEYYIVWSGEDADSWNFKVPDRAAANLIDLIHPYPTAADWDAEAAPDNSVAMAVGDVLEIPITLLFSDFQYVTEGLDKWIQLLNSNSDVVDAYLANDVVVLTAKAAGFSQVQASRTPAVPPVVVTATQFLSEPLTVTVTL